MVLFPERILTEMTVTVIIPSRSTSANYGLVCLLWLDTYTEECIVAIVFIKSPIVISNITNSFRSVSKTAWVVVLIFAHRRWQAFLLFSPAFFWLFAGIMYFLTEMQILF